MATTSSFLTVTVTSSATLATVTSTPDVLFSVGHGVSRAFSWASIGLAVLTAFLQGLVTAIATMTEQSNRWTFRFRLARFEHWWWTMVSVMLLASLVMSTLSFVSGTEGGAIAVLALSATTFLAIVQYMLPAWQEKHFTQNRWLAWTGDSRTFIKRDLAGFCGNAANWRQLVQSNKVRLNQLQSTPSDWYGWHIWPVRGIVWDATDVLNACQPNDQVNTEDGSYHAGLYDNGERESKGISLKWGREQNFRPRVSRAVTSMPLGLLKSSPTTTDGYDGKGLTLAMGILGRNKGLNPDRLVFKMSRPVSVQLENDSTWAPRPAKVLRSFYNKTLSAQYAGISNDFVAASVELALLMADMPHWAIAKWLVEGLEHQSMVVNRFLAREVLLDVPLEEREFALAAHYESSYVSMIISLNNMDRSMTTKHQRGNIINRPDLLCTGLLLKAHGDREPSWWNREDVCERRANEIKYLSLESYWQMPIARLLGLDDWPPGFANNPSLWGDPLPPESILVRHHRPTRKNHQQQDRGVVGPWLNGPGKTRHHRWDEPHEYEIDSDEVDQAHATDNDRRLFDDRAMDRQLGRRRVSRPGDAMEDFRRDISSHASTRVASADQQALQVSAAYSPHQQPSQTREEAEPGQYEGPSLLSPRLRPAYLQLPEQAGTAARSPSSAPASIIPQQIRSAQSSTAQGRIVAEDGYELDIYRGPRTLGS